MSDETREKSAAEIALDQIAAACGCAQWDYPGQVVRDVETLARELAVLRAQLAPLLAVHDALVAAAALPGAGASPEAMVAAVRAQGAREMLAAVDDLLDTALRHHSGRERDVKLPIEERGAAWERAAAVEALMGDVRALPLPGAEVSR